MTLALVSIFRPWRRAFSTSASSSAAQLLRNADAVAFDVDSTVLKTEAINILADFAGVHKEVSDITTLVCL